jgi:hypothetical protein
MKRICAWCQKLIGYKCPLCGEELHQPERSELHGLYMECRGSMPANGSNVMRQSGVLFSIELMKCTHGMCDECQERLTAERLAALAKNNGLPSAADLDIVEAERELQKKGSQHSPSRGANDRALHPQHREHDGVVQPLRQGHRAQRLRWQARPLREPSPSTESGNSTVHHNH